MQQKSRALWLQEGDKNAKIFQWIANSHHQNNTISHLLSDGVLTSDQVMIKGHITQFYETMI